jgi:NAD(P)-dependent dehydrogenase (short-subunit alcohol dehydrogenase family)
MKNTSNERIAVIIGGSSGVGLKAADVFSSHGIKVIIGSRTQERVDLALKSLPPTASGFLIDVTNETSVKNFFDKVHNIDYLIISASDKFPEKKIADTEIPEMIQFADTKLWGAVRCIKYSLKHFRPGGSITLVSGNISRKGRVGSHAKAITNTAIEGITRSFAAELMPDIRVNCISPGIFDSNGTFTQDKIKKLKEDLSLQYIGTSNEVAEMIFSVSINNFMSGSVIYIDRGWLDTYVK